MSGRVLLEEVEGVVGIVLFIYDTMLELSDKLERQYDNCVGVLE